MKKIDIIEAYQLRPELRAFLWLTKKVDYIITDDKGEFIDYSNS